MTQSGWGSPQVRPFIKWPGGKAAELVLLAPKFPREVERYLEPFLGGGAGLLAVETAIPALGNDASHDLIGVYEGLRDGLLGPAFSEMATAWDLLSAAVLWTEDATVGQEELLDRAILVMAPALNRPGFAPVRELLPSRIAAAIGRKFAFMEKAGVEGQPESILRTAVLGGAYIAMRDAANDMPAGPERTVLFWMVRDLCYGAMHRVNGDGAFNVAYGGASYNRRLMTQRLARSGGEALTDRLQNSSFDSGDFEDFLHRRAVGAGDFVFLDPPYDKQFSSYDGRSFGPEDHRRLAAWMARSRARTLLVVSDSPFIRETYASIQGALVEQFDKRYAYGIKGRFSQKATHLAISTNASSELMAAA